MNIHELESMCNKILDFDNFKLNEIDPKNPHGLLVIGGKKVKKIGFGVHASKALFSKALNLGCNTIVVHEGFIKHSEEFSNDFVHSNRIRFLLENGLSMLAYHYLLDRHPILGTNASILQCIGAKLDSPLYYRNNAWGWFGSFHSENLRTLENISDILINNLGKDIRIYPFGSKIIKKIGVLTGSGALRYEMIQQILENDIDLYISGDYEVSTAPICKEIGINYIALGHQKSEELGILNFMKELERKSAIKCIFIESQFKD